MAAEEETLAEKKWTKQNWTCKHTSGMHRKWSAEYLDWAKGTEWDHENRQHLTLFKLQKWMNLIN